MPANDIEEPPTIQAPQSFDNIDHFDRWLRDVYIPATDGNFTECWGIFSADGHFLRYHHSSFWTFLTPELETALQGNMMSHNHPTNSTFSDKDLKTWAFLKMKEMRVVTATYRFILKPKNGSWPTEEAIENEMERLRDQFERETSEFNCLSGPDNSQLRDKCLKAMADSDWFFYSKENFSERYDPL